MRYYEAKVPANTTATFYLPVDEATASAVSAEGITYVGMTVSMAEGYVTAE